MAVVVEPEITYYSLDPMVLTKEFSLVRGSISRLRTIFHSKCGCLSDPI